ncbi:MAG: DsbC family protein [Burkholderiales bacterium]
MSLLVSLHNLSMLRPIAVLLCLIPACVSANEAAIRKILEPMLGGARIEAVEPAPVAGLFEVRVQTAEGLRILYTDATGAYIVQGSIVEPRTGRDLTEEKLRKLSAIKFESLPLERAVTIKRGNGRRVLAMFSDPYCPACKQFEGALQQVEDITIHVFMFPVIRPALAEHSSAVWCARDRGTAWLDLVLRGKRPGANTACANPIERNLELGRSLRVNATPTLILANGERYSGGLPIPELTKLLDQAAASQSSRPR